MNVVALDVKPEALARACAPLLAADANAIIGIVDLGWAGATLSLMHQGVAIYGRTLGDCGIYKLYHTLSTRLGLEIEVIDYLLSESGISGPAPAAAAPVVPAPLRSSGGRGGHGGPRKAKA